MLPRTQDFLKVSQGNKNEQHITDYATYELKIGEFVPEFMGKMQFYLTVLDDKVRMADENPSIGIILCKEKNRTIVEYALKEANKPIGVATYKMFKELPKELQNDLPSPEQIALLLDHINKK